MPNVKKTTELVKRHAHTRKFLGNSSMDELIEVAEGIGESDAEVLFWTIASKSKMPTVNCTIISINKTNSMEMLMCVNFQKIKPATIPA